MKGRKPLPAEAISAKMMKKSKSAVKNRKNNDLNLRSDTQLRCPKRLSAGAKREWARIIAQYKATNAELLCGLDLQALTMYCEATAIYNSAEIEWAKSKSVIAEIPVLEGLTGEELKAAITRYKAAQGNINMCVAIMTQQSTIIIRLLEQLCLSPVGRARMALNKPKDNKNPFADLIDDD